MKDRIKTLQNALKTGEALLICSSFNRLYLTGFETSDGYVLITPENACFLTDFRYIEKAKSTVKSMDTMLCQKGAADVYALCKDFGTKTLYLETQYISLAQKARLLSVFEGICISDDGRFDTLIYDMRSVKSPKEQDAIIRAQKLTDDTFSYILGNIKAGRTEREVMLDMEFYMRRLGSEGVSFDFIVVSGKNSSLPHGVPTNKKIENGDFVTMDFGAVVNGYRSDMTRTVAVGSVSGEQKAVYETVKRAQTAAIAKIKAGECCRDIDKAARDIINAAGYEGCFGHGLGHSVGLEIHESPAFNTRCDTRLKAGTVMTVEPGIYLENRFGVRIEDMVFVTENGCTDITNSTKELIIL